MDTIHVINDAKAREGARTNQKMTFVGVEHLGHQREHVMFRLLASNGPSCGMQIMNYHPEEEDGMLGMERYGRRPAAHRWPFLAYIPVITSRN